MKKNRRRNRIVLAAALLLGCLLPSVCHAGQLSELPQLGQLSSFCETRLKEKLPAGILLEDAHLLENERSTAAVCRTAEDTVGFSAAEYLNQLGAYVVVRVEEALNVREAADPSAQKLATMENGAVAQVLDIVKTDGSDWYHIESGAVEGYICSDYCLKGEDAIAAAMAEIRP